MTLFALYLLSYDGSPIFTEVFEKHQNVILPDQFSGIYAESILKSKETIGSDIEMLRILGLNYHLRYFEKFILTLISDEEPLGSILDKIGATFGLA
jgi:hypothetical protein